MASTKPESKLEGESPPTSMPSDSQTESLPPSGVTDTTDPSSAAPTSTSPSASATGPGSEATAEAETTPALPALTPAEFRVYNRLAEQMDYFHDHFRSMWTTLYSACTSGRRPANMSLKRFLDEGLRLLRYLESHHHIEETHLYPLLARKMPQFKSSGPPPAMKALKFNKDAGGGARKKEACELLLQHQEIHKGMDELEEYIRKCKSGETPLELGVLKEKMDSWGEVLMKHLDQEVEELKAETMRKYWTLEEMRAIPI
ncbi:hypothetical protein QBC35DRAFT_500692 [Podospora australis]|uniref:Hemerythrin-like domain-containing protein n=1 Tax=Podospora australis TaxID=1536484 RepID=A0AAN6WQU6_9PEZI|nr:hypothetical protein QBC35DRAFT_500692 [Podospora australis]